VLLLLLMLLSLLPPSFSPPTWEAEQFVVVCLTL
jgi:hypothetical protein